MFNMLMTLLKVMDKEFISIQGRDSSVQKMFDILIYSQSYREKLYNMIKIITRWNMLKTKNNIKYSKNKQ